MGDSVPLFRRSNTQGRRQSQANATKRNNGICFLPYLQPLVKRGQEKKLSKAFSSVLAISFARILTRHFDSGIFINKSIQTDMENAAHTDSGIDCTENSSDST